MGTMDAQEVRSATEMNRGDAFPPTPPPLRTRYNFPLTGGGWALRDEKGKRRG